MNRLAAVLTAADVAVDVDAGDRKQLFDRAGAICEQHCAAAPGSISDSLLAREWLGSTGLGHGVAIPHCRVKGLKEPIAAVLRLLRPIAFAAPDSEPVGLFVFLFVPEAATQRHLEILSEIAEMISDRALRERLAGGSSAGELHAAVSAWTATARRS